jgi:hypothetical protein
MMSTKSNALCGSIHKNPPIPHNPLWRGVQGMQRSRVRSEAVRQSEGGQVDRLTDEQMNMWIVGYMGRHMDIWTYGTYEQVDIWTYGHMGMIGWWDVHRNIGTGEQGPG